VLGELSCEVLEQRRPDDPETRGRIARPESEVRGHQPGEQRDESASRDRDGVAAGTVETVAHHQVGATAAGGVEEIADVLDRVLAIGVYLHHGVVAMLDGVSETGLQRATDASVRAQGEHIGACGSGVFGSAIGAAVVDDEAVVAERGDVGHHLGDGAVLVVRGHHHQDAVDGGPLGRARRPDCTGRSTSCFGGRRHHAVVTGASATDRRSDRATHAAPSQMSAVTCTSVAAGCT
jgi:hypothetical protein